MVVRRSMWKYLMNMLITSLLLLTMSHNPYYFRLEGHEDGRAQLVSMVWAAAHLKDDRSETQNSLLVPLGFLLILIRPPAWGCQDSSTGRPTGTGTPTTSLPPSTSLLLLTWDRLLLISFSNPGVKSKRTPAPGVIYHRCEQHWNNQSAWQPHIPPGSSDRSRAESGQDQVPYQIFNTRSTLLSSFPFKIPSHPRSKNQLQLSGWVFADFFSPLKVICVIDGHIAIGPARVVAAVRLREADRVRLVLRAAPRVDPRAQPADHLRRLPALPRHPRPVLLLPPQPVCRLQRIVSRAGF